MKIRGIVDEGELEFRLMVSFECRVERCTFQIKIHVDRIMFFEEEKSLINLNFQLDSLPIG